jgi:hypothetical protein
MNREKEIMGQVFELSCGLEEDRVFLEETGGDGLCDHWCNRSLSSR